MDLELDNIFQKSERVTLRAKPAAESVFSSAKLLPDKKSGDAEETLAQKRPRHEETPERLLRTLFVGNVPITIVSDRRVRRALKQIFERVGPVESLRIRSVIGKNALPKKVACITGQTIEERDACNVFVVMKEHAACVQAEEQLNGQVFEGKHLRVDAAENANKKPHSKKSVFVGNLPHLVNDEVLWTLFGDCGVVTSVRVVRDRETGVGKGFGYVAFQDKAAIGLALQLNGSDCGGRPIRVSKCAKPGYQAIKRERLERRQSKLGHEKQNDSGASTSRPKTHSRSQGSTRDRTGARPASKHAQKTQLPRLESRSSRPKVVPLSKEAERHQHPAARRLERKLRKTQTPTTKGAKVRKTLSKHQSKQLGSSRPAKVSNKQAKRMNK